MKMMSSTKVFGKIFFFGGGAAGLGTAAVGVGMWLSTFFINGEGRTAGAYAVSCAAAWAGLMGTTGSMSTTGSTGYAVSNSTAFLAGAGAGAVAICGDVKICGKAAAMWFLMCFCV